MQKNEPTMEKGIHYIENVFEYNDLLGVETLHPLVSVIDMSQARRVSHQRQTYGFYTVFLKEVKCGDMSGAGAGYRHRRQWRSLSAERVGVGLPSRPGSRHLARTQHP